MGVKKSVSKKKKQIQAVWLKFGEYWFYWLYDWTNA
jgi:hypothetical protein